MGNEIERGNRLHELAGTQAGTSSPDETLTPRQGQMVDEVDVESVASFTIVRCKGISPVVICLHLNVRALAEVVLPMRQQVASRYGHSLVLDKLSGGRERSYSHTFAH